MKKDGFRNVGIYIKNQNLCVVCCVFAHTVVTVINKLCQCVFVGRDVFSVHAGVREGGQYQQ